MNPDQHETKGSKLPQAEENPETAMGLLKQFTLKEKVYMVSGVMPFYKGSYLMAGKEFGYASRPWAAANNERLGVDGVKFVDGPRGIILKGGVTFPAAIARGATFDAELEERIGETIGQELVTLGGNAFGGVCVNLLRHPAWGRAQETYGEDSCLLGEMGSAMTKGVEKYGMAVVKHFALNSMENKRFRLNVRIENRTLHEIYLRHFKRIVTEAKPSFVMSSYNKVNGDYAGENYYLLTEVLKLRWGFTGAVMTDFVFGLRDAKKSIMAGQDLEMPFKQSFNPKLLGLLAANEVSIARLDDAVLRLLRVQLKPRVPAQPYQRKDHIEMSLQAARESFVLLQNTGDLLPLKVQASSTMGRTKKAIGVFGRLANVRNTGDHGSSNTQPDCVVTCLEGIEAAFGSDSVRYCASDVEQEVAAVAIDTEVCVVVVGYTYIDEGEYLVPKLDKEEMAVFPKPRIWDLPYLVLLGLSSLKQSIFGSRHAMMGVGGDRVSLELREEDRRMIDLLTKYNENVVVVVMSGSAFLCETWKHKVKSLLCIWYPGEAGGTALGEVLSGKTTPGGKLPMTIPTSVDHLPFFDRNVEQIDYGFWHGYRKLDHENIVPAFPFGFGLSYTQFYLSDAKVQREEMQIVALEGDVNDQALLHEINAIHCSVNVENVGQVTGDEVVQVYIEPIQSAVEPRAVKELIAFKRIKDLQPSERRLVEFCISAERIAYFDERIGSFIVEPIEYDLIFARSSRDPEQVRVRFKVIED